MEIVQLVQKSERIVDLKTPALRDAEPCRQTLKIGTEFIADAKSRDGPLSPVKAQRASGGAVDFFDSFGGDHENRSFDKSQFKPVIRYVFGVRARQWLGRE